MIPPALAGSATALYVRRILDPTPIGFPIPHSEASVTPVLREVQEAARSLRDTLERRRR